MSRSDLRGQNSRNLSSFIRRSFAAALRRLPFLLPTRSSHFLIFVTSYLLIFLSCSLSSTASTQKPPALEDFAYGIPVEVGSDGAIYELALPIEFYQGVTRADLSDAALFNGDGEIVPFALRHPSVESQRPSSTLPLPVFPVQAEPDRRLDRLSLQIRRDSTGAIIDVNTDNASAPEQKIVAYLLDASSLKQPVKALDLLWDPSPEGFVGKVSVEASDDLDHWSTLVKDATIASLRYGEHSLVQRRIALGQSRARYLRLLWPETREDVRLTEATAHLIDEAPEQPRQWLTLRATVKQERPGEYFFDASGFMPVDRLRVKLPRKNTLASVTILSRPHEKADWRLRQKETVYNLRIAGEDFSNPDMEFASTPDRYWMLAIERSGWGIGEGLPELEVGWIAQQLIFVAQGDGPFRLAYGNAGLEPTGLQNRDLLNRFTTLHKDKIVIERVQTGAPVILGGESKLKPPAPPIPWKQWILWLTLLLGVLLLAWMAQRLYRQMSLQNKEQSKDR